MQGGTGCVGHIREQKFVLGHDRKSSVKNERTPKPGIQYGVLFSEPIFAVQFPSILRSSHMSPFMVAILGFLCKLGKLLDFEEENEGKSAMRFPQI